MRAASDNIPALIPGGDRRDMGKCLHAMNNAVACSRRPTVLCSPLPKMVKIKITKCFLKFKQYNYLNQILKFIPLVQIINCLVDLCLKLRSNSCWVFVGDAPAINRAVASYKNTLAVANYKF